MATHRMLMVKTAQLIAGISLVLGTTLYAAGKAASPGDRFYSVTTYGAEGDGVHLDTRAINKTIETAAASGGGTVYFPPGDYLTGSIHLESNIALYIDQGAKIIAAPAKEDSAEYDGPEPAVNDQYQDYGHSHFHNSLIWGVDLHDISITGQGMIWGKGLVRSGRKGDYWANKSVSLLRCRNVVIKDISILHGGWFAILATGVDNLTISNLKMDTNRDGMDIDCCRHVRISDCLVNSPFDDGICLKSSFALGYARATENVTITNCQVSGYDEGTLLDGTFKRDYKRYSDGTSTGRIKMGTESNGGFKNITISNCVFDYCRGLALETVDGALLEDIAIDNITMRDITNSPIFIRLGARMRAPDTMNVGECRRIIISNLDVYNADPRYGCIISGIPGHDIRDLELNNIHIHYRGGGSRELSDREVPEYEKEYPEPYRFKDMPDYGFFIRHVNGLTLNNVSVTYDGNEQRPAFITDRVKNARFRFMRAKTEADASPLKLRSCENISLFRSFDIPDVTLKTVTAKTFRQKPLDMKKLFLMSTIALSLIPARIFAQTPTSHDQKMTWWRQARFGMFIHWGDYSVLGGVYKGHQVNHGGEWIMNRGKIPVAEYQQYARQFNPVKYDADAWVKMARDAGMKYIVITSKHHDGFAMFRTKASKWNIVDATPYGKDVLKPLAAACRKYGIKLGFYYSQAQDWNNPGGAVARKKATDGWANPDSARIDAYTAAHEGHWDPYQTTRSMADYIDQVAVPQVRELLTNYGDVAILWWDTPSHMTDEFAAKLQALLRLQPGIITNDRLKRPNFPGDYLTPEQHIPASAIAGKDFEVCMTMNGTWGYKSFDHHWKSVKTLVRNLIDIASKGGNYLLNVGPKSDGTFPQESVDILKGIGSWMKVNSEAIYGTQKSPLPALSWGRCTVKEEGGNSILYLSVFDWPEDQVLFVPGVKNKIVSCQLLSGGKTLVSHPGGDGLTIRVPATAPSDIASVIKLEIKGSL